MTIDTDIWVEKDSSGRVRIYAKKKNKCSFCLLLFTPDGRITNIGGLPEHLGFDLRMAN